MHRRVCDQIDDSQHISPLSAGSLLLRTSGEQKWSKALSFFSLEDGKMNLFGNRVIILKLLVHSLSAKYFTIIGLQLQGEIINTLAILYINIHILWLFSVAINVK